MITKFKPVFQPFIAIIAKPFLFIHPNIITLIGLLFPILFLFFLLQGNYVLCLVMSVGFVFDAIDGYVARYSKKSSAFGEILDGTVDRVSDGLIIAAFGFAGLVEWPLVIPVLLSTYLISFIKARGEATAKTIIKEGLMQRTERLVVIFLSVFLSAFFAKNVGNMIFFFTFLALCVLNAVTIFQRLWFFYKIS